MRLASIFAIASGVPARDELAAFVARFRSEIDDPIGAFDHFEIVLDHDERLPGFDQSLKQLHQQRDIVEMQSGRRFVEDEEVAASESVSVLAGDVIRQMADELEPLRFAAGKSIERLPEPQVTEPDFVEHVERIAQLCRFADLREELDRFAHRQLEES